MLLRALLSYYEKDVEPPLAPGMSNTTVAMGLAIQCAEGFSVYVEVDAWARMVT